MEIAKTALDNSISSLYHYQPYNRKYLEKLLREKTIYCSNPKNFNDPWDCKPWFDLSLLDDVNEYSKVKDFLTKQIQLAPHVNPDLLEEVIEKSVGNRNCIENTLTSLFSGVADSHAKSFRIYCLTPYCENTLMWAHYADRHTGI